MPKRRLNQSQEIVYAPFVGEDVIMRDEHQKVIDRAPKNLVKPRKKRPWWIPKGHRGPDDAHITNEEKISKYHQRKGEIAKSKRERWDAPIAWSVAQQRERDREEAEKSWAASKRDWWNDLPDWRKRQIKRDKQREIQARNVARRDNYMRQHDIISLGDGRVKLVKKPAPKGVWDAENVFMVMGNAGIHYENAKGERVNKDGSPMGLTAEQRSLIARNRLAAQIKRRKAIAKAKLYAKYGAKPVYLFSQRY